MSTTDTITVRISAVAFYDHEGRLYNTKHTIIDGLAYSHYPAIHCDDSYAIERGLPSTDTTIISVKHGKPLVIVTMTPTAIAEMLSDFDYYSDALEQGALEEDCHALAKSMRGAAKSIRKQIAK